MNKRKNNSKIIRKRTTNNNLLDKSFFDINDTILKKKIRIKNSIFSDMPDNKLNNIEFILANGLEKINKKFSKLLNNFHKMEEKLLDIETKLESEGKKDIEIDKLKERIYELENNIDNDTGIREENLEDHTYKYSFYS